jgi:plasmid stabilization system protein ParE
MTLEILEEAAEELIEAALYYESKEPGLGRRFRDEVTRVLARIAEDPTLWRERAESRTVDIAGILR